MATKSTRYIDDQGRIVLPHHIRKALNLASGNVVEVALEDDNTIRIRPSTERCCICGGSVENKHHTQISPAPNKKLICFDCAQKVAKAMIK